MRLATCRIIQEKPEASRIPHLEKAKNVGNKRAGWGAGHMIWTRARQRWGETEGSDEKHVEEEMELDGEKTEP